MRRIEIHRSHQEASGGVRDFLKPIVPGSNPCAGTTSVFDFGPQTLGSPRRIATILPSVAFGLAIRGQIRTREQWSFGPPLTTAGAGISCLSPHRIPLVAPESSAHGPGP
jgi:hypothetical protein